MHVEPRAYREEYVQGYSDLHPAVKTEHHTPEDPVVQSKSAGFGLGFKASVTLNPNPCEMETPLLLLDGTNKVGVRL